MLFFERQKVDEIGIRSVKFQKWMLFLIIIQVISILLSGFALLIPSLIYLIVLLLAFKAAVKRNACCLSCYGVLHVLFAVFIIIGGLVALVGFHRMEHQLCESAPDENAHLFKVWNDYDTHGRKHETYYHGIPLAPFQAPCWEIQNDTHCEKNYTYSEYVGECINGKFKFHPRNDDKNESHHFSLWLIPFIIFGIFLASVKIFTVITAFRLACMIRRANGGCCRSKACSKPEYVFVPVSSNVNPDQFPVGYAPPPVPPTQFNDNYKGKASVDQVHQDEELARKLQAQFNNEV
jgi:hypothetical protein